MQLIDLYRQCLHYCKRKKICYASPTIEQPSFIPTTLNLYKLVKSNILDDLTRRGETFVFCEMFCAKIVVAKKMWFHRKKYFNLGILLCHLCLLHFTALRGKSCWRLVQIPSFHAIVSLKHGLKLQTYFIYYTKNLSDRRKTW